MKKTFYAPNALVKTPLKKVSGVVKKEDFAKTVKLGFPLIVGPRS